jgi:hypothetical protein
MKFNDKLKLRQTWSKMWYLASSGKVELIKPKCGPPHLTYLPLTLYYSRTTPGPSNCVWGESGGRFNSRIKNFLPPSFDCVASQHNQSWPAAPLPLNYGVIEGRERAKQPFFILFTCKKTIFYEVKSKGKRGEGLTSLAKAKGETRIIPVNGSNPLISWLSIIARLGRPYQTCFFLCYGKLSVWHYRTSPPISTRLYGFDAYSPDNTSILIAKYACLKASKRLR